MKREEVKEIFKDATEDEIDKILNAFGKELNPIKKQLKDAEDARDAAEKSLESTSQESLSYKQQLEQAQQKINENLSDEERIAQREKEAEDREREFIMKSNRLDAKTMFVEAGCFEAEDIDKLVEQVTVADANQTKENAQLIVDTVIKQREAVAKVTKDELLKSNPKLQGGDNGKGEMPTTVKEFLDLPYEKQLSLKDADPNLISQLTKE